MCELARQPTTIVMRVSDMQACVGERVRLECAALEGRVTPAAVCEADLIGAVFGRGQGTDADAWPQRATQFVRVKTDARIVAAGTEVIHIDEACIEARQTPLPLADQPRVAIDLTFSPVVIEARSHAISAIGMALDEMQAGSSTESAAGESVPVQSDAKANTLALALSTPLLALSVPQSGAERCVAAVLGDVHISFRAESNGKRTAAARSGRVGMLIAAPAQVASVPDRAEPLDIELSGGEVASCSGSDAVEIALDSHVPSNVYELRVRARGVRGRIDSRVKDALVEATQVCSVLADASENSTALGKRHAEDERLSSDGTCESTKCGAADTINTSVDRSAQHAGPVALAWVDIGTTNVGLSDDRGDFAFAQFESTLSLLTREFGYSSRRNFLLFAYIGAVLMVGFNRRFAPLLIDLQQQLTRLIGPRAFIYTCNAGSIPADHWTQDPFLGGGRLIGEACHFVDLLRHLAASPIEDLQLLSAADSKPCPDTFSLQLRFADGSIGTVHYFASGSKAFPKERLEVFAAGKVLRLDNYRKLQAWGIPGFSTHRLLSQDKGQQACCAAFLKAIEAGGPSPIPVSELFEVQRWLLEAVNQ